MRLRDAVLLSVTFAGGCGDDASPSPDRTQPDAAMPDAPALIDAAMLDAPALIDAAMPDAPGPIDAAVDRCASAPTGDWIGYARLDRSGGGAAHDEVRAEVRWTLASSAACVDRYTPSGTAFDRTDTCDELIVPGSAAIAATDGELVIDRTTAPPTYTLHGATPWTGTDTCEGDPPAPATTVGGAWADDARGSFDGDVLSGGYDDDLNANEWRFTRAGAAFPAPSPCAEPAQDQWTGTGEAWGLHAQITWTRTATTGCVDIFAPSGSVTQPAYATPTCTTVTASPASMPIAAGDGTLTIDRSTSPPTFHAHGRTSWTGTRTCTAADGSMTTAAASLGGDWLWFVFGAYDGDGWSGATSYAGQAYAWHLHR